MRKSIQYLFFIFANLAFGQEYKMAPQELKGKVKSVETVLLSNNNQQIPQELKSFDRKGRLLESKTYYDGRLNTYERSVFRGNTITTELCDYCDDLDKAFANFSIKENQKDPYSGYLTNDPTRTFKTIKTTDKNGNVVVSKTYNSEGYLNWVTKSAYDKKSNLILKENFDEEGRKMPSYKSSKYNARGLLEEEITFDNNFERKSFYTYDISGRKIAEKVVQADRTTVMLYEYLTEIDTLKVLTYAMILKDKTKNLQKIKQTYTVNGTKTSKETNFYNGKSSNVAFSEFDKNNNLVLSKTYNDKNELRQEIKFVNDAKGNWISMEYGYLVNARYNGSVPKPEWRINKYIRTIEYY